MAKRGRPVGFRMPRRHYSVWDNATDRLVICDAIPEECCVAMGISIKSWKSTLSRHRRGMYKRWTILPCDPIEEDEY